MKEGGIFPAIVGTVILIVGTMLFSLPLGILSAIYLVEYAKDNFFTRLIKLSVVNLSGIPSIVYGLFGFTAVRGVLALRDIDSGRFVDAGDHESAGRSSRRQRKPWRPCRRAYPRDQSVAGRDAMADGTLLRAALCDSGDSDGDGAESQPGGGRDGPDPFYRGGVLSAADCRVRSSTR